MSGWNGGVSYLTSTSRPFSTVLKVWEWEREDEPAIEPNVPHTKEYSLSDRAEYNLQIKQKKKREKIRQKVLSWPNKFHVGKIVRRVQPIRFLSFP